MVPPKKFVSLFCGVGAFDVVLKDMGMTCVLACDLSESCRKIYVANHGRDTPWHDDIFTLEALPYHDVLVGGPPCVAFSSAGNRLGFDDPKNGKMVHRMLHLLEMTHVKPRLVVIENVYGLMTMQKGDLLRFIVTALETMGYTVQVKQTRAQQYGAPMLRHRIFIVARIGEFPSDMPPPPMKQGKLRDILSGGPYTWLPPEKYVLLPRAQWVATPDRKIFCGYLAGRCLKANTPATTPSAHSQGVRIYSVDGIVEGFTHHRHAVYLGWGQGIRYLTDREMFSCMGFPEDFVLSESGTHARIQCGNSINLFSLRPLLKWALTGIVS
jgi:DNA (cytosine-5)-methyltransferase 1